MENMGVGNIFSKKDQLETAKLQLKKILETDKDDVQTITNLESRIKELENDTQLGAGDIASTLDIEDSWKVDSLDQLEDIEAQIEKLEMTEQTDDVKKTLENLKKRRTQFQIEL